MPIVRRSTPIMANSASSEVVLHSKYALFLFSGIRQNKGIAIGTGKQDMVFVYLGFTRPVQLFKLGFSRHALLPAPIGCGSIIASRQIVVAIDGTVSP